MYRNLPLFVLAYLILTTPSLVQAKEVTIPMIIYGEPKTQVSIRDANPKGKQPSGIVDNGRQTVDHKACARLLKGYECGGSDYAFFPGIKLTVGKNYYLVCTFPDGRTGTRIITLEAGSDFIKLPCPED